MTISTPSSSVAVSKTETRLGWFSDAPELRLAREALLHVHGAVGMQPLDGDLAAEALVLAQEDGRHAAGAQVTDHPVAAVEH